MGGIDLVVPICADQHQVLHIRTGSKILEQIERRRVEPLQIVEEQRQRMFRPREHSDKSPKDELESTLALCGGSSGTGGCSPMMSFNSGTRSTMSFRSDPAPREARRAKAPAPLRSCRAAAGSGSERLAPAWIRNVAFVLIELAGGEKAARRHERFVQLVYDRRLADAGITGDQDEFRGAAVDDAIEGGEQGLDLACRP